MLAFEYLHYLDIIYRFVVVVVVVVVFWGFILLFSFRDLKPENILIDEQGYVKVMQLKLYILSMVNCAITYLFIPPIRSQTSDSLRGSKGGHGHFAGHQNIWRQKLSYRR